uniref:Uncharacterized protein n=1 Tax=Rhodopseudomonas palustris (strain BisA53) TaxID=316055 RepID=Q07IA7_RHOP5
MVSGLSGVASDYYRSASTYSSTTTLTRADALPDAPATTDSATSRYRIDISQLKPLSAKPISAADDPALRDMLATGWLMMQGSQATQSVASDDASQKTYAQVKVNGKVVATLDNGGCSTMTNEAAAKVGDLQDPPGLGGPDLAQWRADNYARRLGGTVEKASTAITQSQWTPHESWSTSYSREQLDAAFQAMLAEGQRSAAQSQSTYASKAQAGSSADLSA